MSANGEYSYDAEKREIHGPGLVVALDIVENDADALEFIKALNVAYLRGFSAGEENERRRAAVDGGGKPA